MIVYSGVKRIKSHNYHHFISKWCHSKIEKGEEQLHISKAWQDQASDHTLLHTCVCFAQNSYPTHSGSTVPVCVSISTQSEWCLPFFARKGAPSVALRLPFLPPAEREHAERNPSDSTWNKHMGGVHTGMPNRFRIGLAQTGLDPTHFTMWVEPGLALVRNVEKMAATWTDAETM